MNHPNKGGILLTTLVLFLLFIIMMVAAIDYVNQQYKAATDQEEVQRSFRVAEAGVDYTMFLLGQSVQTMTSLKAQGTSAAQTVKEPNTSNVIGSFVNTYSEPTGGATTEAIQVISKGTISNNNRCETVRAVIERKNDRYSLTAWDHVLGC